MPKLGWRWLLALSSLPSSILLLFYRMTPESPRYLCLRGKTTEAYHILEKIARINGTTLPSGILVSDGERELENRSLLSPSNSDGAVHEGAKGDSDSVSDPTDIEIDNLTSEQNGSKLGCLSSLFMLLSPELIKSTLLLWVVFFGNAFSYYGLVLLTTELNSGNNRCASSEPMLYKKSQDINYKDVFITSFAGLVL